MIFTFVWLYLRLYRGTVFIHVTFCGGVTRAVLKLVLFVAFVDFKVPLLGRLSNKVPLRVERQGVSDTYWLKTRPVPAVAPCQGSVSRLSGSRGSGRQLQSSLYGYSNRILLFCAVGRRLSHCIEYDVQWVLHVQTEGKLDTVEHSAKSLIGDEEQASHLGSTAKHCFLVGLLQIVLRRVCAWALRPNRSSSLSLLVYHSA